MVRILNILKQSYNKKLEQGNGSFTLDAANEGIADGSYTVQFFIEGKDNGDRFTPLDNTKLIIDIDTIES